VFYTYATWIISWLIIVSSPHQDTSPKHNSKEDGEGGSSAAPVSKVRLPHHDCIILSPGSDCVFYEQLLQMERVVVGKDGAENDLTMIKESVTWWRTAVDATLET